MSANVAETPTRAMCWQCLRPKSACYCAAVVRVVTRTRVVILQHPRERDVPIGTARIAELGLSQLERFVGVDFESSAQVESLLSDAERPALLLYPSPGAPVLEELLAVCPRTLVVIDGTWWQASKVLKHNARLRALPRYALPSGPESRYRVRREPAGHCLSTVEAVARALSVLERDQSVVERLLRPFDQMVERQLAFAQGASAPRHRRPTRAPRRRPVPEILRERAGAVVVAHAEANAWPYGTPGAPPPELVHLAAERLVTGECFEAYVRPTGPIAPSFTRQTDLAAERVLAGESVEQVEARWRAFLGPNPVLAGWGYFSSELVRQRGGWIPERLDVREAAIRFLGRKAGELEDYAREFGVTSRPWAAGRTGRRLALVAAIAASLRAHWI